MLERHGELHRFLHQEIGSEEALEIAIFLYRHRERPWTAAEIRERLSMERGATEVAESIAVKRLELRLTHLRQMRILVTENQKYRYEPGNADIERRMSALAAMDDTSRTAAIQLIYLKPRSGLDAFADAFSPRRN